MASLTQVLASSNAAPIEDINIAGNLNEGLKAGINLATAKEQVESAKMKISDQKLELATKQATAMTNRTKAAMFAQSPAAFESIMKANEAYANSINVPYNSDALRAAWKDPNLRLAAQRETNRVMAGGQLANPQAIIDFYGSDSPAIFDHLQNASYAAGVKQKGYDFEFEKQRRALEAQKEIAAIGVGKSTAKQVAQETKDYKQALRLSANKFDETTRKDREALTQLAEASNMLATGEAIPQSAARRSLAKAYNTGALTDNDVNDFAGDKALASRFIQALETGSTGELTEDNIRQLLIIADNASKRKAGNILASAKDTASRFSRIYPSETSEEEIIKTIYPEHFIESNKIKETQPVKSLDQVVKEALIKNPKADPVKLRSVFSAKGYK